MTPSGAQPPAHLCSFKEQSHHFPLVFCVVIKTRASSKSCYSPVCSLLPQTELTPPPSSISPSSFISASFSFAALKTNHNWFQKWLGYVYTAYLSFCYYEFKDCHTSGCEPKPDEHLILSTQSSWVPRVRANLLIQRLSFTLMKHGRGMRVSARGDSVKHTLQAHAGSASLR